MTFPNLLSRLVWLLLLGSLGASCKRSDPTPTDLSSAQRQRDQEKDRVYTWLQTNFLGAYERVGQHNPRWDDAAKSALNLLATARANRPGLAADWQHEVSNLAQSAVARGCADPLVRYAAVRYAIEDLLHPNTNSVALLLALVQDMDRSDYPPQVKFYVSVRTGEAMLHALPETNQSPSDRYQVYQRFLQASGNLQETLQDTTTPPSEVHTMCLALLEAVQRNREMFPEFWQKIDTSLREHWSKSEITGLLVGWFNINYAWQARGSGYANKVTPEGFRLFQERMEIAERSLRTAWNLNNTDSRIPTEMLRVCIGLSKDRKEMENWFRRAMLLAPNNYDACANKLHYLNPQWFGSEEEMLAFGHECIRNTNWSGTVPLVMVDVHDFFARFQENATERQAYWLRPEVWPNIKSAYEEFFRREPDAVSWHHNYAFYAYKCRAWDDLNAHLKLLGTVNYSYFGGQAAFDKMVTEAKAHAKP